MSKEKEKGLSPEQTKGLQKYRRSTVLLITLLLFLSLWTTVINNLDWTFKDIITEVLCLLTITIVGMFANLENNFSLFHIRRLKMTKERLISVLIGMFFPLVFIIYVMVTNDSFMQYIRNISLHNSITLLILAVPIIAIISLIIYLGYLTIEPRRKVKAINYKPEIESSLDSYKKATLNILTAISLTSIWVKIGLNINWNIADINTEIVLLLIILVMNIIGNVNSKLPWNYCNKTKLNKYILVGPFIPYILVFLYYIISSDFRMRVDLMGYQKIISLMTYIFPIILVVIYAVYYIYKITDNKPKNKTKINNHIENGKRTENIIISLSLTTIAIILLFINIINNIIELLTVELLLQTIIVLIPLGVILYIIIYYSIIDINK